MKDLKDYNEYIQITRDRLKNYKKFRATAENLNDAINTLEDMIASDVAAPVSRYGDEPGGGSSELNTVEAAAERHLAMRAEIGEKQKAITYINLTIRNIDRAIESLSREKQILIRGYYIEGKDWQTVADEASLSYNHASSKGRKALREVAGVLFADKVTPEQLQLDFFFA